MRPVLPCGCSPDGAERCAEYRRLRVERDRAAELGDWRLHHELLAACVRHLSGTHGNGAGSGANAEGTVY